MQSPATLPQCWLIQARSHRGSGQPAARQKEFGIWNRWTWDAEYGQVRDLALGLATLNVRSGDRVALIGDNDCQYLWAALALLALGATLIGIPSDATAAEVRSVLSHAEASLVFASDQEQCDKLLDLKPDLPQVGQVIYWRDRGMWLYNDPWLLAFGAVQERGRAAGAPDRFDEQIAAGAGDDVALLCYTAGVAGPPRAVLLSHANILAASRALAAVDPRSPADNYLSFVPLTSAVGAMFELAAHALDGVILNFAEKPETVPQNVREIAPDRLLYPARLWENLAATIQLAMLDASWLNRRIYVATQNAPAGEKGGGLLRAIGQAALLRPLLGQVGLHRARAAYTTGARLDPAVLDFFHRLGLPLRQLYSANEAAGAIAAQTGATAHSDSLGAPLPGVALRVAGDGEIWVSGPNICLGYYKADPAGATALTTDEQGVRWFRTGDAGRCEDGELWYTDRLDDLIVPDGGPALAPQSIEGALKWSPFISQAMAVCGPAGEIGALIVIDAARAGRWAVERGLSFAGPGELARLPEVGRLLDEEIRRINATLPAAAHVRRWAVLPGAWSADAGELTRSHKLRRGVIRERAAAVIAALWSDRPADPDPAGGAPLLIGSGAGS
jgi:long-chain acyl-CoA synthetase